MSLRGDTLILGRLSREGEILLFLISRNDTSINGFYLKINLQAIHIFLIKSRLR